MGPIRCDSRYRAIISRADPFLAFARKLFRLLGVLVDGEKIVA